MNHDARHFYAALGINAAAPTTTQREAPGSDGGYAAPSDVRSAVAQAILGEASLLGMTDRHTTDAGSITVPFDASAPWGPGTKGGMEDEAAALDLSRAAPKARTVKLHKISTLVPISSELLEDAPGLRAYLARVVPARLDWRATDLIVNGNGIGQPLGLVTSPARVVQAKEGGQAAATINLANTQKMLTRIPASSHATAVWLAQPEAAPQLQALGLPHYVNGAPGQRPTLHGLPVIYTEACAPVGTEGDLVLTDPKGYFSATREPTVREDFSLDLWFDAGQGGARFTMRLGGAPWINAPFARYRTATTVSTVVTLETRS